MPDDLNKHPQVVRSPKPLVEPARGAEERRRVAEISREIEELGRVLEDRDRLARLNTAQGAASAPAQVGQPARGVVDRSTPEPDPALRHEMPTVAGHFSPYARKMITAWQKAQGLPETGSLDEPQIVALLEQVTLTKRAADVMKLGVRRQAATASAKYYQAQQRVKEGPSRTK
jgi:hypothetical protein